MNDELDLGRVLREAGSASTSEFRMRLRHRLESELSGDAFVEPTQGEPVPRAPRTWRWIASAAAVLLVLVGVVLVRSPDPSAPPQDTAPTSTPSPSTVTTPTASSDAELLAAVTGNTWVLTDAEGRTIPSPVPFLAPLAPDADGLVGTFDGCNGGSVDGVIDDGRLRVAGVATTDMACPGIETIALPADGALALAEDGRTLTITDTKGEAPTLTFRRSDALGERIQVDQLVGSWRGGDAVAVAFGADSTLTAGACTLSWVLDDSGVLRVYGIPPSYDDSCPTGFLAAAAGNRPLTARLDDDGTLWLVGDPTVLRLERLDELPVSAPRTWPTIDIAPWLFPIDDLEPCQPENCPSIALAPDGTIVSYDAANHAITVGQRGSLSARAVPIDGPPPASGWLVGIGPDDVAYLVVKTPGAADPIGDVIAVPISGPNAGDVVARASGVADLSGDSTLVATRAGWVSVGCCGFDPVVPIPEQTPLLGWVDQSGAPVTFDAPVFSMERSDDTITFVHTEADGTRATWTIPAAEALGMRGMPDAAVGDDGSVIVAWWNSAEGGQRLLRLRPDGEIWEIIVPATLSTYSLSPFGAAIVYDGSAFKMWQLPGLTDRTDATTRLAELVGPGPFASADELVSELLQQLSRPDGCDVAPSATVVDRVENPEVFITVAARYGCDDSGGGADIAVTLTQTSNGSWIVKEAEQRGLCLRGSGDGVCV